MYSRNAAIGMALFATFAAHAQDKAPPPPYIMAGGHHCIVGVVWNEEALKLLPF